MAERAELAENAFDPEDVNPFILDDERSE